LTNTFLPVRFKILRGQVFQQFIPLKLKRGYWGFGGNGTFLSNPNNYEE